jgi:hypothetical protein
LLAYPGAGALALLWLIGGYAIVFGVLLLALSWRLYDWHRHSGTEIPVVSSSSMPRESSAMS